MDNWITIKTFTLPTEVVMLRGRLESEGIECLVLNELTTQVNPFYSNAIGGVQLQVKESDLENAIAILKDVGYSTEEETQPSKVFLNLESSTSKIPLIKKLPLLFRLMILIALFVVLISSIFVYVNLPTTYEKLTANRWCVENVVYDNKNFIPQTEDLIGLSGSGFCEESITFRDNGTVTLPGFKSHHVMGHWKLENNLLQISSTDNFDFLYDGNYHIDFENDRLVLKSEKTVLNCHAERIHVNLPF